MRVCFELLSRQRAKEQRAKTLTTKPTYNSYSAPISIWLSNRVFKRFSSFDAIKYLSSNTVSSFSGFALPTEAAHGYSAYRGMGGITALVAERLCARESRQLSGSSTSKGLPSSRRSRAINWM